MSINKKYGYVRVSSKSQESNSSIEFQKQSVITDTFFEKNTVKSFMFKGYGKIRVNQFK